VSDRVWVLDASALIHFKKIAVGKQWAAFKLLEEMVLLGSIAMPRLVIKEASEIMHPDMPGAWAAGVKDSLIHPLDPAVDPYVRNVMAVAGDVVDPNSPDDDADPYVVALALELCASGYDAVVVTDDVVDRMPIKISLETACTRCQVKSVNAEQFLLAIGLLTRRVKEDTDIDAAE
jgi:hypothetical protein